MKYILLNDENQIYVLEMFSFHQKATWQQGYSLVPQNIPLR